MQGDVDGARRDHIESSAVAEAMGHELLAAQALGQLAVVDLMTGHVEDGRAHLRVQVDRLRPLHRDEGLGYALDNAAALAVHEARWEVAARAAAAAASLRERIQVPAWPLMRPYHDASVRAARPHLGSRWEASAVDVLRADPWPIVDEALAGGAHLRA